jgi:hypothetical protein
MPNPFNPQIITLTLKIIYSNYGTEVGDPCISTPGIVKGSCPPTQYTNNPSNYFLILQYDTYP